MTIYHDVDRYPRQAEEANAELFEYGKVLLGWGQNVVLVATDLANQRMFIGMEKAGVWISAGTPANKFELIKGGFRFDIAERLVAVLKALATSKLDVEMTSAQVPQIGGPENKED